MAKAAKKANTQYLGYTIQETAPVNPRGIVHQQFLDQVQKLATDAAKIDFACRQQDIRPWMLPARSGWNGDPLNIQDTTKAFKRDEINDKYIEAVKDPEDPGSTADCMASKIQCDYLAVEERAFRTRHMTCVRGIAHAGGRRWGHGKAAGIFTGSVLTYVQDVIQAGGRG